MRKRDFCVYVGVLSDTISDEHVQNLFSGYGIVAPAEVLRHKYSTKSAGYWFIEMASAEQAWDSAVSLEGVLLAGHSLRLYVTPYASQTS